jgi:hypothetical protein
MGRPLKIQKLNAGVQTDAGYPQFANLDPTTQVIPVGMTSDEFLGVVGGANTGIATSTFPVVKITANVNGQEGSAYIITQKGTYKYLVSGENSVNAGSFTPGFSYQILSLGNTDWTSIGAGINPTVGDVFTATDAGAGSGTASDCGQCQLVANSTINAGEMNMVFNVNSGSAYASRLTNKYIWDNNTPPNRYAVNFFVAGTSSPVTLTSVAITSNAGAFSCANTTIGLGELLTISGTLSNVATGTISGYTNPTTYFVTATNGINTFTLSATEGGANIVTGVGNTTGLTFATISSSTAKSGADGVTFANGTGDLTLAQVQNYTS